MILGRFAENPASGMLIGHIRTLFFRSDAVTLEHLPEPAAGAPSHRIYSGDEIELGAAWRSKSKDDGSHHYDVKLDDPTFAAPIYARLVRGKVKKDGYVLIWERRKTKAEPPPART